MRALGRQDRSAAERGSAVVDFVLVGALLTVFCMSVIQLMLILHVRNTLIDAAASGARYGALADRTPSDAEARTVELITSALNAGYAQDVTTQEVDIEGIRTLEISVRAPMPVLGLLGPGGLMEVRGHAALPG
ncbi:TadE/TadG family type IV pilus assembly protein [Paenarthrobacter sp. NPDC057981]|uniref:TadE/TadG family type IV pilus assembly protein n=1 Tax=Paenarthrobacter sp. NPDC057981 TaxID=3346297 RepID=UPI0036DD21F0